MASSKKAVTLNFYDLSQGMARQLSASMLGQHFDGIWHTGIVVEGEEFFYQSGLQRAPAGRTAFGPPTKTEFLGNTSVEMDVFEDFLRGLAVRYTPDAYHLLDNNCNSFTNECSQFLLGKDIPVDVTSMGDRFKGTPLGAMLTPMIDQMMQQQAEMIQSSPMMQNGMFGSAPGHRPILPYSRGAQVSATAKAASQGPIGAAPTAAVASPSIKLLDYTQPVLFTLGNVSQIMTKFTEALEEEAVTKSSWREKWKANLDTMLPVLTSIATTGQPPANFSVTLAQFWVDTLLTLCEVMPMRRKFMAFDLLRLLLVIPEASDVASLKLVALLRQLSSPAEETPYAVALMVTRSAANAFSSTGCGKTLLGDDARETVISFALKALLGKDVRMKLAGATLAYNVATILPKSDEDTMTEILSALLHMLQPSAETHDGKEQATVELDEETIFTSLMAVGHLLKANPSAQELAMVLGFDVSKYISSPFGKVQSIANEISQLLA